MNKNVKPLNPPKIYDSVVAKSNEVKGLKVHGLHKGKRIGTNILLKIYKLAPTRIRNFARILAIFSLNYVFIRGSLKSMRKRVIHATALEGIDKGLVSVVLPTYNHAKYLKQSIESVLNQSYKNLELIIVNDGSNDVTRDLLKEYENSSAITIIHQENAGLPNALNRGFTIAKGEFLTWTSADNFYEKTAIVAMVDFLEINKEVGVVYGNYFAINQNGQKMVATDNWRSYDRNLVDPAVVELPKHARFFKRTPINSIGPQFLYRASSARIVGNYSNTPGIEDYDFWSRMEIVTKLMRLPTEEALYSYRVHDESISGYLKEEHQMKKTIEVLIRISNKRFLETKFEKLVGTEITEHTYAEYWDTK